MHRIARAQFESAQAEFKSRSVSAANVHNCRKAIKRLRALVRLLRPVITETAWRQCNTSLRDTARLLSNERDAAVIPDTLSSLEVYAETVGDGAAKKALKIYRDTLVPDTASTTGRLDPALAAKVRKRLAACAGRFHQIRLAGTGKQAVEAGIAKSYRVGRRAFKAARRSSDSEAFHDVRKAVQWHWRHMALLENAWPDVMRVRAEDARTISQDLGEDHDIAVLLDHVRGARGLDASTVKAIARLCARRHDELRAQVEGRLARLFSEPPDDFGKRVAGYWVEARRAARAQNGTSKPPKSGQAAAAKTAAAPATAAPAAAANSPAKRRRGKGSGTPAKSLA